jgi:hypothetical protein
MADLFDRTNYPEREPDRLIAGDRWTWKRTDLGSDYPPASYALSYSFRLEAAGSVEQEITAVESGQDYIVEVGSAETASYPAGTYVWQAYITRSSDSERITVGRGVTEIVADRAQAPDDPRSHVKKVLDALEALIEGKASVDQLSYSIAGRSVSRLSPDELLRWRNKYRQYYRNELAQKQASRGLATGRRVRVRLH